MVVATGPARSLGPPTAAGRGSSRLHCTVDDRPSGEAAASASRRLLFASHRVLSVAHSPSRARSAYTLFKRVGADGILLGEDASAHEAIAMQYSALSLGLATALAMAGCVGGESPSSPPDGPTVAVNVAALSLAGVGDVVWDVEVDNGRSPTADVVWQRRLSSSGYGDGAGSASYVGPCDADPAVSDNTVKVWVVGVFSAPVSALGGFASGEPNGVAGDALDFQNPTVAGPLTQRVACRENTDVAVQFDVALMRPASQGFFDIAVAFSDIFCSAKFDCCRDANHDDVCASGGAEDLTLLFDAGGARARTMVLGLACTAGVETGVDTELYLDAIALDCTSGGVFSADLIIDPSAGPGNACAAGAVSACGALVEVGGTSADDYLFQVASYRGAEQLTSGGVEARKVYWNVALGVTDQISGCRLRTRATAHDRNSTDGLVGAGAIAAGATYPYIAWDVPLGTCAEEPLTFGSGGDVTTEYTGNAGGETAFAYFFGPSAPAGAFAETAAGTGADGSVTVSGAVDLSTDTLIWNRSCADGGDAVAYALASDAAAGQPQLTLAVAPSAGCLNPGDEVWIETLGATGAPALAELGVVQRRRVVQVANAVVTLDGDLASPLYPSSGVVVVQRVPNYLDLTVAAGGTLTAGAWQGTVGGVLALRVKGTLALDGTLSMAARGYRGSAATGEPEAYGGVFTSAGGGGGGGGGYDASYGGSAGAGGLPGGTNGTDNTGGNGSNGGGGGGAGSYVGGGGTPGGGSSGSGSGDGNNGSVGVDGTGGGGGPADAGGGGGGGAAPYDSEVNRSSVDLSGAILPGGGAARGGGAGGGGGGYSQPTSGGGGGSANGTGGARGTGSGPGALPTAGAPGADGLAGGGVLVVHASAIAIGATGAIDASGGAGGAGGTGGLGGEGNGGYGSGGGGGGHGADGAAGGAILLHAKAITGAGLLAATGGPAGLAGAGGASQAPRGNRGGDGSAGSPGATGRIRLEAGSASDLGSLTITPGATVVSY